MSGPAQPPFQWVETISVGCRHATALTVSVGCEVWTLCGRRVRMTALPRAEQPSCDECMAVWAEVEATAPTGGAL